MPGGETFAAPVQYSPLWLLLAVLIIVLVVGWYVFVLVLTRRRATPQQHYSGDFADLTTTVRESYVARIDDVRARYAAGAIGFAEAHHELSALVRAFAAQAQGVRAQYMTLDDLRHTPHAALAQTVERLYPGAFSGRTDGSIDEATARASELVQRWN